MSEEIEVPCCKIVIELSNNASLNGSTWALLIVLKTLTTHPDYVNLMLRLLR